MSFWLISFLQSQLQSSLTAVVKSYASCLACLFFPGQNANISKSPHQPVQVQSPHISQRGFARILLWNFARCPLHPLRPFVFFKRFLKKHELHSLPALVAIAAENSLLFMAYGATQRLVSRMARVQEEELDVLGHGLAGGLKILLTYLLFNRQFS